MATANDVADTVALVAVRSQRAAEAAEANASQLADIAVSVGRCDQRGRMHDKDIAKLRNQMALWHQRWVAQVNDNAELRDRVARLEGQLRQVLGMVGNVGVGKLFDM